METLKNLTLVQWIGIMVGLNSLLMGATPQLTVLFGTPAVPYIIAIATLGNGALGVFVTVVGGQGSQLRNVQAMPGVERISVNDQANQILAAEAMNPDNKKIAALPAAQSAVAKIAAAGAVLLAIMLGSLWANPAMAQGSVKASVTMTKDKTVPVAATRDPMSLLKTFAINDIQAALDDATANGDQAGIDCWSAMLPAIQNAQNPLPTKLGAFLALQKARDAVRGVDMFKAGVGPLADLKNKCAAIIVDTNTFLIRLGVLSGGAAFGF